MIRKACLVAWTLAALASGQTAPPELHVEGNQLRTADGKVVWLQGLVLDSMEWTARGERILESIPVAVEQWHANVIRLPVKEDFWFGDDGESYRKLVDAAVEAAGSRGAYLALDLHRFGAPTAKHAAFWKSAAERYRNHPAVLFDLFNEPHSVSAKVWRDGGSLKGPENRRADVNVAENTQKQDGDVSCGMQALIDAVRSTGAKNIVIAGGLDWGYDLSFVVKDYPLQERPGGNGIMYSTHVYPWKKDWQANMLDAAAKYPIFIGEVGNPEKWEDFKFIPEGQRYEAVGAESAWPPDMLAVIQKYKLHWTGFSFHPRCGPKVIADWDYTPTPYWGVFVRDALAGKRFELKRMR